MLHGQLLPWVLLRSSLVAVNNATFTTRFAQSPVRVVAANTAFGSSSQLAPAGRDLAKMEKAFNDNWEDIYSLAEMVADRHVRDQAPLPFSEDIVERLMPADVEYDHSWKSKVTVSGEGKSAVATA